MEKLGLKQFNSKYLKKNEHTEGAKFFWTKEKRIAIDEVPEEYYRYRVRHHDNASGIPVTLEKNVIINHYHDVLCNQRIDYLEADNKNYIPLFKEDA